MNERSINVEECLYPTVALHALSLQVSFLRRVTLKCIYHNLNVAPKKLDSRLYHSVLIFSYLYIKIGFISLYMFVNLLSHIVSVLNGFFLRLRQSVGYQF
jgi:hypothetical protein